MEMQQKTGSNTITEEGSPFQDPILPSPRRPFTNDSNNSSQRGGSSGRSSAAGFNLLGRGTKNDFHSRSIDKTNEIPKPWTSKKDSRKKWHTLLPLIGVFIGICFSALECRQGWKSAINKNYCLLYEEDFVGGRLDDNMWIEEISVVGSG